MYDCKIKGKLRLKNINSTNPVVVGDIVRVDGTSTAIAIATIDSDTQLGFAAKIGIKQGQTYTIISAANSRSLQVSRISWRSSYLRR